MFTKRVVLKGLLTPSLALMTWVALYYGHKAAADTLVPSVGKELYFAQLADGGGYATRIILVNPGETDLSVTMDLFRSDGSPFTVTINGSANSTFSLSVKARGALFLKTAAIAATVATGWARVQANGPLGGSIIYGYQPAGKTAVEAGLDPSALVKEFCFTVDTRQDFNSGLAVANPTNAPVEIRYALYDSNGSLKGLASQQLGAWQHAPKLIGEIFPNQDFKEFTGLVIAQATGGSVIATTLRFDMALNTLNSIPVITGLTLASIPTSTLAPTTTLASTTTRPPTTTLAPTTTQLPTTTLVPTTTRPTTTTTTSTSASTTTSLSSPSTTLPAGTGYWRLVAVEYHEELYIPGCYPDSKVGDEKEITVTADACADAVPKPHSVYKMVWAAPASILVPERVLDFKATVTLFQNANPDYIVGAYLQGKFLGYNMHPNTASYWDTGPIGPCCGSVAASGGTLFPFDNMALSTPIKIPNGPGDGRMQFTVAAKSSSRWWWNYVYQWVAPGQLEPGP